MDEDVSCVFAFRVAVFRSFGFCCGFRLFVLQGSFC